MSYWEYSVHVEQSAGFLTSGNINPRELQNVMNAYGQQGWELVSTFDTNDNAGGSRFVVLAFKRPLGDHFAGSPAR